jgi:CheY-like chemotaxis protein
MVPRIRTKNYFPFIFVILAVTIGIILFVVQSGTNDITAELTRNRAGTANRALVNHLQSIQDSAIRQLELIARSKTFIRLIQNSNHASLREFLKDRIMGMDSATVCDADGIVLARTHSVKIGDSLSAYKAVASALRTGRSSIAIEEMKINGRFSIFASVPVMHDAVLIGVVSYRFDLEKTTYLDLLQEETGCYSAIFNGNRRVSTTLLNQDGKRAVGRAIGTTANNEIVKTVLHEGNTYSGRLFMFGRMYEGYLTPLASGGEIVGMLGTSIDIDAIAKKQRAMHYLILLAFSIGLSIAGLAIVFSSRAARELTTIHAELFTEKTMSAELEQEEDAQSQPDNTGISRDPAAAQAALEGKRVLLVEDVEINREILTAMLEETRISVDCAEDGRQALEVFSANPDKYDVILMDVHMPEMDGMEATRLIRALDAPESARVPILAITANVFPDEVQEYLTAGMNDYIGKPVDCATLLDKLTRYCTGEYIDAAEMQAHTGGSAAFS